MISILFSRLPLVATLGVALLSAPQLYADAQFQYRGAAIVGDGRILVSGNQVRLTAADPSGIAVDYDSGPGRFKLLDPQRQRYSELELPFARALMSGIRQVFPQMRAFQAGGASNAELQALREALTLSRATASASTAVDTGSALAIKATGDTGRAMGLSCQVLAVTLAASTYSACVVPQEIVGMHPADIVGLRNLSIDLTSLEAGPEIHQLQQLARIIGGLSGVMLELRGSDGQVLATLERLTLDSLDDAVFAVPASFRQVELDTLLGG